MSSHVEMFKQMLQCFGFFCVLMSFFLFFDVNRGLKDMNELFIFRPDSLVAG